MHFEVPQWIKENRLTSKSTTTVVGGLIYIANVLTLINITGIVNFYFEGENYIFLLPKKKNR